MTSSAAVVPLEPVEDADRAELLLHPLRQRILAEAREATTAAEIARRIGLSAQKVNYHVRTLAEAGFLQPAGEGRKRNLVEKRYRASARSYVLLPQVLGDMRAGSLEDADRFSATYLMHLSALLQQELGAWLDADGRDGARVPTLSLETELRFESANQRSAFADALQRAIADVVGRFTSPARDTRGRRTSGRPYRLVLGCYPVPGPEAERTGPSASEQQSRST